MNIVDRYILRKFLGTFFFMLVLIMAIAIVFDITEKVEDFRKGASMDEIIFDYYLNFIAFYGNMFSAMIVFISTILFTSKMTTNSEIVAILTGGVSFRRMLYPYLVGSTVIFILSLMLNHFVIPKTNVKRLKFENTYVGHYVERNAQDIHRQIKPNHMIYFETFNPSRMSGYNFTYEVFDEEKGLVSKLKSGFVRYDSTDARWILDSWNLRYIGEDGVEEISQGKRLDTTFAFSPKELSTKVQTSAMMTTPELLEYTEAERLRGSENLKHYRLEFHRRTAWPFATFVLILIAVSLSTRKKRGGLGINIAIGLLICLVYIFMMQISTTFATVGNMSPLVATWLPNIVFSILGVYLYYTAPK